MPYFQLDSYRSSHLVINNFVVRTNTLSQGWYAHKKKLMELEITDENINKIESYAFNCEAFRTVKNLTLINMPVTTLQNNIFEGLPYLSAIHLIGFRLKTIENGVLPLKPNLNTILISFSIEPETTINELFNKSASDMPQIGNLIYEDNNLAVVTKELFGSLTAIMNILLPRNQITTIAVDAFEVVGEHVSYINLQENHLRTLPDGIFHKIVALVSKKPHIFIRDNPWHCTCELLWLQKLRTKHIFLRGVMECSTPEYFTGKVFELCDLCNPQISTTNFGTLITTSQPTDSITNGATNIVTKNKTTPATTTSSGNVMSLVCSFGDDNSHIEIDFEREHHLLSVTENRKGSIKVKVHSFFGDSMLIWWGNDFPQKMHSQNVDVNCMAPKGDSNVQQVRMILVRAKLVVDKTYMFCLANSKNLVILPLNCISYRHSTSDMPMVQNKPWLTIDEKMQIIAAVCLVSLVVAAIGVIQLYSLLKSIHRSFKGNK